MEAEAEYVPMTPADYDRLAAILGSFPSEDAMNLEELDGYFCALACSPQEIPSEQYMPLLWGSVADEDELFPDIEAVAHFIGLINRHFGGLMLRLEAEEDFKPLLLANESGELTASAWAWGFVRCMRLCLEPWDELVEDEKYNDLLLPILVLAQERDPDPDPDLPPPLEEPITPELREVLVQAMAAAAPLIYDYFRETREEGRGAGDDDDLFWERDSLREDFQPQAPYRRDTPKIGRNEPCPCGSGKKYKRCCGKDDL